MIRKEPFIYKDAGSPNYLKTSYHHFSLKAERFSSVTYVMNLSVDFYVLSI